ncbi:MAG TPA: TadE/TadG family type IV pilus assembly protein [Rhizomicrobium sp.]|nr:TadE/TadG family type IV pilus assembly protein [Rhizomicrobium sp.]
MMWDRSWRALKSIAAKLVKERRGNVATIFALTLIPITIAAGAGLDLSRALMVRARLAEALDAAGLAVGASQGLSNDQITSLARAYFKANYTADSSFGTPAQVTVTPGTQSVTLSTSVSMPTTLMNVVGINSLKVGYTSKVVWGQTKLWVSLVLDNTGSMCQSDSNPNAGSPCVNPDPGSKIALLKSSVGDLLTILNSASANPGDVKVAIIPFTKDVDVGTSNVNASWIDWTDWDAANGTCSISSKHSKSSCTSTNGTWTNGSCNISGISSQNTCTTTHGTWTSNWRGGSCNISGYNSQTSCQNAVGTWTPGSCNLSGYNTQSTCQAATAVWTPNNHSTWTGCIMDRGTDTAPSPPTTTSGYDVSNATPVSGTPASQFPAEQYSGCQFTSYGSTYKLALVLPLTNVNGSGGVNSVLTDELNTLVANGNTNQGIGVAWGWQALTDGDPLDPGTLPQNTQKIIILLSDGLNTQNRWTSTQTSIDDREKVACDNAKSDHVLIYSIFVDIGGTQGSSSALQYCAGSTPGSGDSSKYYDLTSASQIDDAFKAIGTQITQLRVAQ